MNTILPKTSPSAITAKPSRAWSIGSSRSISGRAPVASSIVTSAASSSRVPIVEPITESWRKKIRVSSASSSCGPEVVPEVMIRPPGRSERTECDQVAFPTVSMTASAFSGSRSPDSNAAWAPISSALARLASSRLVTSTRSPAARPSTIAAVATPPPAPCTSTVSPGLQLAAGEEHPVGREPRGRQAGRLGERQRRRLGHDVARAGTATRSAIAPWWRSESSDRFGSKVSSPFQDGSLITPWTTTSLPSSSRPAASVPRIIGSCSCLSPTPRSENRSWWFSDAALTVIVVHPSGTSGSGRSPTTRPDSGSSGSKDSA